VGAGVVVGAAVVVGVVVVVGAAEVVVGATVVVVSLAAVSVVPPEQAETNNARIRNQAVSRFMIGVCHGTPERFSVTTCALGRPLARSETTERPEISGLSSIIRLVELGGIDSQKTVQGVRLDRSCLWNQGFVSDVYACLRLVVCHL